MCVLACSAEKALSTRYDFITNTRTKHAKYSDKTHNFTPGGEINAILTCQKTLVRVIRLGVSFSVHRLGAPVAPLSGRTENDTALVYRQVSIVYLSFH